jgi:hypothetical protein
MVELDWIAGLPPDLFSLLNSLRLCCQAPPELAVTHMEEHSVYDAWNEEGKGSKSPFEMRSPEAGSGEGLTRLSGKLCLLL